jgi:prepilin-type N-terminal cleavage/methylation domain-containing protein
MRRIRTPEGFTLIEAIIVVAIVAIGAMLAVPNFTRYRLREQARDATTQIARVLREARSESVRTGTQRFVIFNAGNAQLVTDIDGDWQVTAGVDLVQTFAWQTSLDDSVTPYPGASAPYAGVAPRAQFDQGAGTIDSPSTQNGASFPAGPTGAPAVGFTTQGIAVAAAGPAPAPGSGQGAFYVTDGMNTVFAVTVAPLGDVQILRFREFANDWN